MRIFVLILLFLPTLCFGGVDLTRLEASAAFTPPHNEPIIGDMVARYKVEGDAGIRYWRLTLDGNIKFWGLNPWDPPSVVGHGFPEAWQNSRWGVERVRMDWNVKAGIDLYGPIQAFVEHNKYRHISGSVPSSHANEYYWMTGFRYKYR